MKKINNWNFYFFYFTDAKHLKKNFIFEKNYQLDSKTSITQPKTSLRKQFQKKPWPYLKQFFKIWTNDPAPFNIRLALRRGHYSFKHWNQCCFKEKQIATFSCCFQAQIFLPKRFIIKGNYCLERQPWTLYSRTLRLCQRLGNWQGQDNASLIMKDIKSYCIFNPYGVR